MNDGLVETIFAGVRIRVHPAKAAEIARKRKVTGSLPFLRAIIRTVVRARLEDEEEGKKRRRDRR